MESRESRRINVTFSPSAYAVLAEIAQEKGASLSEVLRDAIALEKFFQDTRREGGKILVERDGSVRELIRV